MEKKMTYKESGVDVDAGNRAVELMKSHVKSTFRKEVLGGIGGFAGFFQLDVEKYKNPVLVSGTDGVGTKLKLSFLQDKHDTIGIDCVAMCVNDIIVHGAEPLFFLDYIAVGKLEPEKVAQIVKGVSLGCKMAGCALIGGETAEMPGFYKTDEYDLAGFAVGVVEKEKILDGSLVREGDVVIGLASTGVHSNGYSLIRKVLLEKAGLSPSGYIEELGKTLGEELLTPTKIYVDIVNSLNSFDIHAMAHITGGGIIENLPRVLPKGLGIKIFKDSWKVQPIFKLIQNYGQISDREMHRTFNMGVGYTLIVSPDDVDSIINTIKAQGEDASVIGKVVSGVNGVIFCEN